MKAGQGGRPCLVALQAAARPRVEGLQQNGLGALGKAEQPVQIHGVLLIALGLDMVREVVKKAAVLLLLERLGKAAGAVADGVVAATVFAIGKQQS